MTAVERTESPATAPAAPVQGCGAFETVMRSRRDDLLARMMSANLRLGNLADQASVMADDLRRLIAFYDDELALVERHGKSLFGEGDPQPDMETAEDREARRREEGKRRARAWRDRQRKIREAEKAEAA